MVNFFKKYKVLFLIAVIIIFIVSLLILINSKILNTNQNLPAKTDLKGYELLKQSLGELDKDPSIPKNARYQRLKEKIISLQNPSLSKKDKYNNLALAESSLFDVYLSIKNNKLYVLHEKFTDFAKTNFSEYYKISDFRLDCFDPACADSPQPKEILEIIKEIESSDLPEETRKLHIENLVNYTYTTREHISARVQNYYYQALSIRKDPEFEKLGLNIKISDEIIDYLKNNYSDLLFKISGKKY